MSGWSAIRDSFGKVITLGQKTKANSLPVTIASDEDALPVSGTVAVSNLPGTQPVSGTIAVSNLPATQPVSAASALPVSENAATAVTATLQSAAAATGNGTTLNVAGMATAILTLTGTFVGTITWEVSEDGGTTWTATSPSQYGVVSQSTTATAPGLFQFPVAGLTSLRARISAYTSGSITVTGHAVPLEFPHRGVVSQGNVASGVADTGNPVKAGGKYNATPPTLTDGQRGDVQLDAAGNLKTAPSAGENHLGEVGGKTTTPAASTFTRPADTTAYAAGDLVANSTTAGSVTPLQFTVARVAAGSGMIRRVRLRKSGASITNASFRLHLYAATPTTITNGDNGAWSTSGVADYLGSLDVTMDKSFTDGASGNGVPSWGAEINFALASGQVIFGLWEARAAYTPSSGETFSSSLEVLQN